MGLNTQNFVQIKFNAALKKFVLGVKSSDAIYICIISTYLIIIIIKTQANQEE